MCKRITGLFLALIFSFFCFNQSSALSPSRATYCKIMAHWTIDMLKQHKDAIVATLFTQAIAAGMLMLMEKGRAVIAGNATRTFVIRDYAQCPAEMGLLAPGTDHEEIQEIIELFRHPERLAAFNVPMEKGLIISGPEGSGKKSHAYSIARNGNARIIVCSAATLINENMGSGAKSIIEFFQRAQSRSIMYRLKRLIVSPLAWLCMVKQGPEVPTIALLTNLEAIARPREGDINTEDTARKQERENTLQALMTELDSSHNVFFIGTTSLLKCQLDSAIGDRPDRARTVDMKNLTEKQRASVLTFCRTRSEQCPFSEKFNGNGTGFASFARKIAQNATPAVLKATINRAVQRYMQTGEVVPRKNLVSAYLSVEPQNCLEAAR